MSRSGPMVRHRNLYSVIASINKGFKPLKQHFISFLFFNIRFNWALTIRIGAMVRHGYFQIEIELLIRGSIP